MEDRFEISYLLDYYGALLTEKQLDVMNLYYNEDLSLAEIAEINETSRQAIHDAIKRCFKQLVIYEEKLKLLEKQRQKLKIKEELMNALITKHNVSNDVKVMVENKLEDILNA